MILGLSAGFHDAGVTLVNNTGDIIFAAHAERYSGIKNDAQLNKDIINDVLNYGIPEHIAWYEKPWIKRSRQLYSGEWKKAFNFSHTPKKMIKNLLPFPIKINYYGHHLCHAAAGFQTSPYESAIILVVDAIGEWDTISVWNAHYNKNGFAVYKKIWSQMYPHSIGLYYSAITQYVGLKPMEDEYILMGMAAYSKNCYTAYKENLKLWRDTINCELIDNLHAGLDSKYFDNIKCTDFDLAAGAQKVVEQLLLNLVKNHVGTSNNLVFMGGVALNCVANSLIKQNVKNLWIMPNPGDCGSSLGAAALKYAKRLNWKGPYLGHNISGYYPIDNILKELCTNGIVGVASGRAEFGPRALGARSLLADPRGNDIKNRVNKIKQRQKFRPFAPMVLEEYSESIFEMNGQVNPYMQNVYRCKQPERYPAIVHADGTSRVQTVGKNDNPDVRKLLEKWHSMTNCPLLLNTSLNIKGEPIVNNRVDADRFEKLYGIKVYS